VLMNIECGKDALDELTSAFRFNDAVLRNLVMVRNAAVTEPSPFARKEENRDERESGGRASDAEAESADDDENVAEDEEGAA
jgi:small subunit ribosomal protein S6